MKEKNKTVRRTIRNDIILIVALLLVASIVMVYLFVFRDKGDTVKVTVDGKLYATYSLSDNITTDIVTGENKGQVNRLVIKDGKAYIEYATCPDGICVDHSHIFRDGESIVCLPNRVVVTIVKGNSTDTPDVIM